MRYLPLTEADRARDAGGDRRRLDRRAVRRRAAVGAARRARSTCRGPQGEIEVERAIGRMAAQNVAAGSAPFFIGGGAYRHHVPAAVDHLIQRGEFLTSYTPYQPEMAQGHPAISVRVPDPGGAADRHGGRQRLDV